MKIYSYQGKKNLCGKQVRKYRKEMGVTQTEFAARLQLCNVILDQKAISRIELEERVVADYELWAMAKVLEVTIEDLILPGLGEPEAAQKAEGEAEVETEVEAGVEEAEGEQL